MKSHPYVLDTTDLVVILVILVTVKGDAVIESGSN